MPTTFIPSTDAALAGWAATFAEKLVSEGGAYGVSPEQAAQFAATSDAYASALAAATNPTTRTAVQIFEKNSTRDALKAAIRQMARQIDGNPNVSDEQRFGLGLTIRAQPTRTAAPSAAPGVRVKAVTGHRVTLKLYDPSNLARRGKPPAALGAAIYSYVGDDYPTDADPWFYHANSTRSTVEIAFPDTVAAFSRVWFVAHWLSPRLVKGPGSNPICTNLGTGGAAMAGAL